jgi:hypothetical protein
MIREMKGTALILLIVFAIAAFLPVCILSGRIGDPGQPILGTLDVCHSSTPALFGSGSMPCINAAPFQPLPLFHITEIPAIPSSFTHLIFASRRDQPPRS